MTAPLSKDRLNVHQVTLMQCDFRESIEAMARHGIHHVAVWQAKLEEFGLEDSIRVLNDNGMKVDALCAGGLFTENGFEGLDSMLEKNRRWLDKAAAIGAGSMVTITGGLPEGSNDIAKVHAMAVEGLEKLLPHAKSTGVKLALEPLHPMVCGLRSVICTVGDALEVLERFPGEESLGMAVDSYAVWWEPNLKDKLMRAGKRLLNFHVSDWLADTQSVRFDRGMPGDGCINNRLIRSWMEDAGYDGQIEVEIFSEKNWWKRPADEVLSTLVERAVDHL